MLNLLRMRMRAENTNAARHPRPTALLTLAFLPTWGLLGDTSAAPPPHPTALPTLNLLRM